MGFYDIQGVIKSPGKSFSLCFISVFIFFMIFQIMGDLANPAVDSHFEGGGYLFGILVICGPDPRSRLCHVRVVKT